VQKLQVEVKLLWTAARRGFSDDLIAPLPDPSLAPSLSDPAMNGAMQELEARMTRRFQEQERTAANLERVATELLKALRAQPAQVPYTRPPARLFSDSYDGEPAGRVEKALEMLNDKIARIDMMLGTAVERVQKLEETLEAWDTDAAALRDSVTRDIRNFERTIKQQSSAIESARTAMGQTDDLVERVVEALDSLQSMLVQPAEVLAAS
jgi:DNA repair exonuclease SbcCD ATPase subunit